MYRILLALVMATCRVHRTGSEHVATLRARGDRWVYSAWHNNTAMAVWAERAQGVAMMASASADGELIARGIAAFGNQPVRGSTSAQGSKAARDMIRALRNGRIAALTPDGPRGPKYRMQPGALWIAALSGCPLVPYHIEADRQWVARSWDAHKLAKPFSNVHITIGAPYYVDREQLREHQEDMLAEFQARMMENTLRCERLAGR